MPLIEDYECNPEPCKHENWIDAGDSEHEETYCTDCGEDLTSPDKYVIISNKMKEIRDLKINLEILVDQLTDCEVASVYADDLFSDELVIMRERVSNMIVELKHKLRLTDDAPSAFETLFSQPLEAVDEIIKTTFSKPLDK